jgi:hypothetical protein
MRGLPGVIASKSIVTFGRPGNKLDFSPVDGHTQTTMRSKARALELPTPLAVPLLALGFVILSIVVILPR